MKKILPNIFVSNYDSPFNQMTAGVAPKSFSIVIGQNTHKTLFFPECRGDSPLLQQGQEPPPQQTDQVHNRTAQLRSVKSSLLL